MSFELESFKRKATAPLAKAITEGNLEEVKLLCKKYKTVGYGPDQLCACESFGAAHPLFLSLVHDNLEIFKFLVEENKATIDLTVHGLNGMEGNDMTLLHFACLNKGKLPFVKYLLKKGAKANAEDKWGWTPLHCAAFKGHKEIAMNLLVEKAEVNALDAEGESPYDKALRGGHKIILKLLTCQGGTSNVLSTVRLNSISFLPLKVTLLGAAGVGKTSILERFLKNKFSERVSPTFGGVTRQKSLKMKNCQYEMSFYDLGGHSRYHNIAPVYYRGSSVVIVVFDVNKRETYVEAKTWVTELMSVLNPQQVIVLCGNKADKSAGSGGGEREVNKGEVEEFVKNLSLMYVETSAKSGRMVDDLIAYSVKLYNLYVGQYSQTEAPVMLKRETKVVKSHLCLFTDLRTGKAAAYKHTHQQLKDATKTGYMMKEGHFITNWKKRYFVLKNEALYYYREENQPFPAGAISIRDATITTAETRFPHSFQVLTRQLNSAMHEKYVIACESEQEMKEWIAVIEHEKVRYLYERESIRYRIDSEIPIPTDPCLDPVLIECEGKALNFYKDGFYYSIARYPIATYPFTDDLHVRKCQKNPKLVYLSDDSTFLLHLVDPSEGGGAASNNNDQTQLVNFLKTILPANTTFSTMTPDDYLSTFITAYEYACHRLRIPLCQPLIQAFARVQGSGEFLTCLALSKIHLSSQDMEALFYALRWYPFCDELVLTSTALDQVSISILVEEIGLNSNLKSVDLSNNRLGEGATPFILGLLKTKIEVLNLASTDIGVGVGAVLDGLSIEGASRVCDLNLSHCQLGDSIAESLVRMLSVNRFFFFLICFNFDFVLFIYFYLFFFL